MNFDKAIRTIKVRTAEYILIATNRCALELSANGTMGYNGYNFMIGENVVVTNDSGRMCTVRVVRDVPHLGRPWVKMVVQGRWR